MYSDTGHRPHRRRGFPIRKSSDHSPLIGSPRHIADCHVLHRLLMPRHPPCALSNLQTDTQKYSHIKNKMLASTIQFSNNTSRPPHHTHRAQLPEASHRTHTQPPHPHPQRDKDHGDGACCSRTRQCTKPPTVNSTHAPSKHADTRQ